MILKASWEEDQKLHPWILKNTRALGIWLHCLLRVFQLRSEAELRGDWHECVGWLIAQSGAHSDGWSSNQTPLMELTNSAHKGDQHKCCLNLRVAYYQPAGLTILFTIFVSTDHEAFSKRRFSVNETDLLSLLEVHPKKGSWCSSSSHWITSIYKTVCDKFHGEHISSFLDFKIKYRRHRSRWGKKILPKSLEWEKEKEREASKIV